MKSAKSRKLTILTGLLACAAGLAFWIHHAIAGGVLVTWGPSGITSLKYRGQELLSVGEFRVERVMMRDKAGTAFDADLTATVRTDPKSGELRRIFTWGTVTVQYAPSADRLNMTITTKNNSPSTITAVFYEPLAFKFPSKPTNYDGNTPILAHNIGSPGAVGLSYSGGTLAVVNEEMTKPLLMGFPWALDKPASTIFPVKVFTGRNTMLPDSIPTVNRSVAPNESDQFQLSFRFGPEGSTIASLTGDVWKKFATSYPSKIKWNDHRSIGSLVLGTAAGGWRGNPRGWFMDPKIDINSKLGQMELRTRMTAYADESISILRDMNAQGMIVWDVEGEEFRHAITYIGDPRLVPTLAPEMDALADEFFAKFRDAGFRVGVCVRPQVFSHNPGQPPQQRESADPAKVLIEKIAYARKRWDATLFYIDSNGDPNHPMDPEVFRKVNAEFPDVLLVPEHSNLRYYAYTAPLLDMRKGGAGTPENVRLLYPKAFMVINTIDGPIDQRFDDLVTSVSHGDILMYRSWYKDPPVHTKLKTVYQSAQASARPALPRYAIPAFLGFRLQPSLD
jgi:hypothetical protein